MSKSFADTVQDFWQRAGLVSPKYAEDGSTSLFVDDVRLSFTNSEDEMSLIVASDVGSVPTDADSLEVLLGIGTAMLSSHNVLLCLKEQQVIVQGTYPYEMRDIELLTDVMTDVVSITQALEGRVNKRVSPTIIADDGTPADRFIFFQP